MILGGGGEGGYWINPRGILDLLSSILCVCVCLCGVVLEKHWWGWEGMLGCNWTYQDILGHTGTYCGGACIVSQSRTRAALSLQCHPLTRRPQREVGLSSGRN